MDVLDVQGVSTAKTDVHHAARFCQSDLGQRCV